MFIMDAFGIAEYQIAGGPSWIATDRCDIEAKTDGIEGRLPHEQFAALLRALLEDRFRLKTGREKKDSQGWNGRRRPAKEIQVILDWLRRPKFRGLQIRAALPFSPRLKNNSASDWNQRKARWKS
jgi:Protein of unknown function (DUF3738)